MPSWLLSVGTLFVSSIISPAVAHFRPTQHYHLTEKWHGESFLENTEFFTADDPTNGFVTYVNQSSAEISGLFKIKDDGSMYMGVDHSSTLDPNGPGRESVRIESKKFYKQGLYVVDVAHMPGSICGTWPAFWSVGPRWPQDGEIDIIEGVNMHSANEIVLHTSGSCALEPSKEMTGHMSSSECGEASGTIGCVVKGGNDTAGTPFNKKGGGVYAMERTSDFIKIWYFPRGSTPKSLADGKPDTSAFGTPIANLQGSCDFGARFQPQKLVFNTDFCGDWAGGIYGQDGQCPMSDPGDSFKSCHTYVAQNPEQFKEAYWDIKSVEIYIAGAAPQPVHTEKPKPTSEVSPAPETVVPAPAVPEHTTSAAETTQVPAFPSPSKSASKSSSTIYTTSTTTICRHTSHSLPAAPAVGGGIPHHALSGSPTSAAQTPMETSETPAISTSDNAAMGAAAADSSANREATPAPETSPKVTPTNTPSPPTPSRDLVSTTAEIDTEKTTTCPSTTGVTVTGAADTPASSSQAVAPIAASPDTTTDATPTPEFASKTTEVKTEQTTICPSTTGLPSAAAAEAATPSPSETTEVAAPAATPSEASQSIEISTSTDAPEASTSTEVPATPSTPAVHAPSAAPSNAGAVAPSSTLASKTIPASTPSNPVFFEPGASGSPTNGEPAGALFTGASSRSSVSVSGVIGAVVAAAGLLV